MIQRPYPITLVLDDSDDDDDDDDDYEGDDIMDINEEETQERAGDSPRSHQQTSRIIAICSRIEGLTLFKGPSG